MNGLTYNEERHEYLNNGLAVPSLTGMLAADGLSKHLDSVPAATLEAKRDWGSRLHMALQKAEYGYGIEDEFKAHCAGWLDVCRKMDWGNPATGLLPIWKNCELPALARYEGFVFGFTPDRASPRTVVEIKGTYAPAVSHGIQVALQVIGMGYDRKTPRFVCYFDKAGLKRLVTCGPTIKRDGKELDVFAEAERIIFEHGLYWDEKPAETVLVRSKVWDCVRDGFSEEEKTALRAHIHGQVICPAGWTIEISAIEPALAAKLRTALKGKP
jgi:hypothetical protein